LAELTYLTTKGVEDARAKIAQHKDSIKALEERLKNVDAELEALRNQLVSDPPPEEFSQAWAQHNRALVRLLASKERDRMDLVRAKTAATKQYEIYLQLLEKEAEQQLAADKTWWTKRRQEWEHQTQAARDREDKLKVNSVLTDIRAKVIDEDSYSRVQAALKEVEDPEILEAINRVRPGEISRWERLARDQLRTWEQSRP